VSKAAKRRLVALLHLGEGYGSGEAGSEEGGRSSVAEKRFVPGNPKRVNYMAARVD